MGFSPRPERRDMKYVPGIPGAVFVWGKLSAISSQLSAKRNQPEAESGQASVKIDDL
jgi:hypothetical protein